MAMLFTGRPVDEVDRDVLAAFADSLGQIVERAMLIEQLQFQQRVAEQLARSASGLLGGVAGDVPLLESDQQAPIGAVAESQRGGLRADPTRV